MNNFDTSTYLLNNDYIIKTKSLMNDYDDYQMNFHEYESTQPKSLYEKLFLSYEELSSKRFEEFVKLNPYVSEGIKARTPYEYFNYDYVQLLKDYVFHNNVYWALNDLGLLDLIIK